MSECVHGFSLHHQGLILDHTLRLLVSENPANQASKINAMRTFSKPCKIHICIYRGSLVSSRSNITRTTLERVKLSMGHGISS